MPVVVSGPYRAAGWRSILDYAISRGAVLVELRQPPAGYARQEVLDMLSEALSQPLTTRPIRFCFDPQQAGHPQTRLVLTFDPAPDLSEQDLAAGRVRSQSPAADAPARLLVVLAEAEQVQSSAQGHMAARDNTALISLTRQTIRQTIN